jgi:hypothetical protein
MNILHNGFIGKLLKVSPAIYFVFLMGFIPFVFNPVQAQQDTTYYINYRKMLTSRTYVSRKYTSLIIGGINDGSRIRLEPNSTLNLGVGATYNDFTLNLAYGFNFMNRNREQVDTRYLDLQAHVYPKNWVIDFFGQFYNGFFLYSYDGPKINIPQDLAFPDLQVRKFGLNIQYLFNGDKLSLKAAFLQSAWQKKSAGSLVAGMEFYTGRASDEGNILSELIPEPLQFNKVNFFEFGPNIGYVYTLVIKKHFFITGMASANLGLGKTTKYIGINEVDNWGFNSNYFLRGFIGYNGPVWSINANYVQNNVRIEEVEDYATTFLTGNYRVNFVYRFQVGQKLKKHLDYVNLERYIPKGLKPKKEN